MRYDDVLKILREYKNEREYDLGILKLGLFGSAARREQSGQSDIDVAVDLKVHDAQLSQWVWKDANCTTSPFSWA